MECDRRPERVRRHRSVLVVLLEQARLRPRRSLLILAAVTELAAKEGGEPGVDGALYEEPENRGVNKSLQMGFETIFEAQNCQITLEF